MTSRKEAKAEDKPPKCGLIAPIAAMDGCSEAHWEEVRFIIKEALQDTDFIVELVSDSNEIGIIQKRIVENIYYNEMVICDVSGKNPNVMFELGMRLAFDKPTIIIKDDKTNYSFDTAPIEHIEYPRDLHYLTIQNFKTKLKSKVVATYEASKKADYTTFLKHFGQFVTTGIEGKPVGAEQFIVEALMEMKTEIRSLKLDQINLRHQEYKVKTNLIKPSSDNSVRTFVQRHMKENKIDNFLLTQKESAALVEGLTTEFVNVHGLTTLIDSSTRKTISEAVRSAVAELEF